MIFVVVLQNCMDVANAETGSYSETGVTCVNDDGSEGVSIKSEDAVDIKVELCMKVEEAIDIKDDIPPMETEQEVRLWCVCVCEVEVAHALRAFVAQIEAVNLH